MLRRLGFWMARRKTGGVVIGPPPFVPSLSFNDNRNSMYLTVI